MLLLLTLNLIEIGQYYVNIDVVCDQKFNMKLSLIVKSSVESKKINDNKELNFLQRQNNEFMNIGDS